MHEDTEALFYPDEKLTPEDVGLHPETEPGLVDAEAVVVSLEDHYIDQRLDAEKLAVHCVASDREHESRLQSREGESGYADDESVTEYAHEETIYTRSDEWVESNIDHKAFEPFVRTAFDWADEDEAARHAALFRFFSDYVEDEVRPLSIALWRTGEHPDDVDVEEVLSDV